MKIKGLKDMTIEELWELFPIVLAPYNENWGRWGREEIAVLKEVIGDGCVEINHIGSTAIGGIMAKPIVDILVEVAENVEFAEVKSLMEDAGYICMSEGRERMSFNKGYTPAGYAERVFHVHVRRVGDNDEVAFRDYLRVNAEAAREYEALKLSLLPKYRNDRDGYTAAKGEIVRRLTEEAKRWKQGM